MVDVVADLSRVDLPKDRHEFIMRTLNDEIESGTAEISKDPNNPRIAVIRTSDRISFKNCRRRWGWSSHLRHNLGPKQGISPLWFGSGMHFALEDFHGYNRFGHPRAAFEEYVRATKEHNEAKLPEDWKELLELGQGMMDYYILWLQQRTKTILRTFWFNGEPQVEVNFRFKIPFDASKWGYDEVVYSGTIDRITIDEHELLWINDYKSAAHIETLHYATDPQIGVYMWAAPYIYGKDIGGFIYQQHRKAIPHPGRLTYNNTQVSVDAQQLTTRALYKDTLIKMFGSVERAPDKNIQFLNKLAMEESEDFDKFIRIDRIGRNTFSAQAEGVKILMELEDMLNPNLPLYPNPTRECPKFCPFYTPCIAMDDGSDWKHILDNMFELREPVYDSWRKKIRYPNKPELNTIEHLAFEHIEPKVQVTDKEQFETAPPQEDNWLQTE